MTMNLDPLFYPRTVALVGISSNSKKFGAGTWLENLRVLGFRGEIFPVHPKLKEWNELKVCQGIREVPADLDLAVVTVPASSTPQVIMDCVAKGVRFVHLYTAGFGETGTQEGIQLEAEIQNIVREANTRIIGPNSMGVHCPEGGISWAHHYPKGVGYVSVFAQSGANSSEIIAEGSHRGIHINKLVNYGNGCDLNEVDFLNYYASDPRTRVIASYLEGVKQGRRFLEALKEATSQKPVIILKGGVSESGTRAVQSHTASIAGVADIWGSAMEQAGAIGVNDFEEMMDTALAFLTLPALPKPKLAIISTGKGGGGGVLASDKCEKAGLKVPPFPDTRETKFAPWLSRPGYGFRNPIDLPAIFPPQDLKEIIRISASFSEISLVKVILAMDWIVAHKGNALLEKRRNAVLQAAGDCGKPLAIVMPDHQSTEMFELVLKEEKEFLAAGISSFRSVRRAARAINHVAWYSHKRLTLNQPDPVA